MEICLRVGIGDLIVCKALLMSKHEHIDVRLDETLLPLRGGEPFRSFISDLAQLLFSDNDFSFKGFGRNCHTGWDDLYRSGVRPVILPIQSQLCLGTKPFSNKYACLCTKVRGYAYGSFLQQKNKILDILTKLSDRMTIVVLGEREVERNAEYATLTPKNVYSIYEFIKTLPKIEDLTIPAFGLTSPIIDKFRKDCACMHGSVATISIGHGGNLFISGSLGRIIGLEQVNAPIIREMMGERYSEHFDVLSFEKSISELE